MMRRASRVAVPRVLRPSILRTWILPPFLLVALLAGCGRRPPDPATLHRDAFVVDLHADTIDRVLDDGSDFGLLGTAGQMDLPRMEQGGVDLQFFAIWVSPDRISTGEGDPDSSGIRADAMIDKMDEILARYPDRIARATTAAQAREIVASGRVAAAMGLEGGHVIENSLERLCHFYDRGVRYMTLTWNNTNDWADAAKEETENGTHHGGLTEFGEEVVREMNRLGMIVDVSHVSESTFEDVLRITTAPVIASHSCVAAIAPHYRNLTDEQIRAIAANGGVIGINFYPAYLDSAYNRIENRAYETEKATLDSLREALKDDPAESYLRRSEVVLRAMGGYRVPVTAIADHIDYIVGLVGVDHVAFGSDFDGVPDLPTGMEDVSHLPELTRLLVERGYDEIAIRKILGENFLRVFEAVCGS